MQNIKLTVVGDTNVGKTSLLITYTTNAFPSEFIPRVFDPYSANIMVDGRPIQLNLNDTQGNPEYDRLRHLDYVDTQIFFICFALNNRSSFDHVRDKWLPELAQYSPGIPYILVGMKSDLRNDLNSISDTFISVEQANTLKTEIGAVKYMEVSALTTDNLKNLFDDAIRSVNNNRLQLVIDNNNNNNNNNRARRECKCECDWREVLNQSWQLFAFLVALSVYIIIDVWALYIAYSQYNTKDECWNELNKLWFHPKNFLIVGALSSLIGVGVGILLKTVCGIDEEQQDAPRLCILCFFLVWVIIGYVITGQIQSFNQCHQQSIGKITLAWSIVKNIEFCCGSLDIMVNAYKFHFMN